ncbi:MAG TPA: FecR domain-containing protein, partial [Chitinophaga sp.]|nr:FecR domain-containing protein [Chitinophaga sp.]
PSEDPALRQVLERRFRIIEQHISQQRPSGIFRLSWMRAAAAVLLVLLGSGIWYWLSREDKKPVIVESNTDIAPGGNKAVLTLAGGQTIVLDNAVNGTISQQGNARISKQGGHLIYDATVGSAGIGYNTLSIPRGGQYQLTLPDGTQVWLNAASSIRYPVTFAGNERRVYVTGEAYFEVRPASRQPFIVEVRTSSGTAEEVQVLGTHFNINAYEDEPHIATTLLEGKISVARTGTGAPAILAPGQQAQLNKQLKVISKADVEQAMAWKNGLFRFDGVDLKTVMRQLARWYDLDIRYEPGAPVNELFNGEMQRNLNLSQVINGLDGMGVHIRKEGRQLIIMP